MVKCPSNLPAIVLLVSKDDISEMESSLEFPPMS